MSVDRIIGRVAADYREQVRGGFEVNKSALVIETPKNCYECPFSIVDGNDTDIGYCEVEAMLAEEALITEEYYDYDGEEKPDWCPLKPLPEKKLHTAPVSNYELQKNLLADGWNNCIDAITGEVK